MDLAANIKRQLCFLTITSSYSSANNESQGWLSIFALLLIFISLIKPSLSTLCGSNLGLLPFNTLALGRRTVPSPQLLVAVLPGADWVQNGKC